ncbi:MAG: peptidoglycan editing factor PgeF [Clostridium sp.]
MKIIDNDMGTFITIDLKGAVAVFSTANKALNFNKNIIEGIENLAKLKDMYNVKEVRYLNQIHSDRIFSDIDFIGEGDAIITSRREEIIGVFTADCVPVLLYDGEKNIAGAIHSGWKGTLKEIVFKTLKEMNLKYGSNAENIQAIIGPHNRECCYEVSEELIGCFKDSDTYKEKLINKNRFLSLSRCIEIQLKNFGLKDENIHDLNLCTYCSEEYNLHSYRKNQDKNIYGRMFSFIYIK